ncbi:TPM domain-containing protein [Sandaracinobacteroides saxicola]|uniref:TPM domain-containing protein n=1 Tax=Sandaracinobacteroides saxicola TaxID=2759707 RepID=A0A7G5IGX4_9SPHN|nr:TPM domain-containing protein [Sandaracinobacteroides saxicola]QMW22616.1 TPM domain-containing protein [Sandaracinobacteroides saxicola]
MRLILALLLLAFAGLAQAAPTFPALTGRVVDAANILPADVRADLEAKSAALEAATKAQFVVVTLPDLQGLEIEDYGYQLGRAWGIGRAGTNDGVLLIVAPNERRVRIEVGYGLEPVLTDALSSVIIQQAILPRFKAGDLAGGVRDGADAIIRQLGLPPEQARANVAAATASAGAEDDGPGLGALLWLGFLLLWVLFSMRRGRRRSGVVSGGGSSFLWGVATGMLSGGNRGGGWGGGGGGFGGGGFGGGGGGFGGGGSSGGW